MFQTECRLTFHWDTTDLARRDHALALCLVAIEAITMAKETAPIDTTGFMESMKVAPVGYEGPDDAEYNRYKPWEAAGSWQAPTDPSALLGAVEFRDNGDLAVWIGSFIRYAWYAEVGFHVRAYQKADYVLVPGARGLSLATVAAGGQWVEGSHVIQASGDAVMADASAWQRAFARVAERKRAVQYLERAAGDD